MTNCLYSREPDQESWKYCFQLYIQAFREPKSAPEQKKLARILKKPLDVEIEKDLFNYNAFLCGLGRMSLSMSHNFSHSILPIRLIIFSCSIDMEAHGGLYALHSHINHSCTPNVSVRHIDQRTALSRITLIARIPIPAGEELLVSYVNPEMGVKERRKELLNWGFGECRCKRCVEEAKNVKDVESDVEATVLAADGDLERELKAGLGVL